MGETWCFETSLKVPAGSQHQGDAGFHWLAVAGLETSLNHFMPKGKFLRKAWFSVQSTAHGVYFEQSQLPPQPPF